MIPRIWYGVRNIKERQELEIARFHCEVAGIETLERAKEFKNKGVRFKDYQESDANNWQWATRKIRKRAILAWFGLLDKPQKPQTEKWSRVVERE